MNILKYFWWLQVYHFITCFQQKPWSFIIGAVLAPYFLISRLMYPLEVHDEVVTNGITALKSYWQIPGAVLPPKFIEKRFLALEGEIRAGKL